MDGAGTVFFECCTCRKKLSSKNNYLVHLSEVHLKILDYINDDSIRSCPKSSKVWPKHLGKRFLTKGVPLECPLCSTKHKSLSRLKDHMCIRHYRKDILSALCNDTVCPICDQDCLDPSFAVRHYGARHDMVFDFMPGNVRQALEHIGAVKRDNLPLNLPAQEKQDS